MLLPVPVAPSFGAFNERGCLFSSLAIPFPIRLAVVPVVRR